ncbi:MAG: chromosomal replication initiator protein DnaA [Myxococcales bacterium]|nr:chromosomal replication initiator protein DnaA [Myxococcales bacterium]
MQEIWSKALEHLRATTDRPAFESWLSPIRAIGIELAGDTADQLQLSVPDPYFLDYVESNLYDKICSSVAHAAARPLDVRLLVADPSLMNPALMTPPHVNATTMNAASMNAAPTAINFDTSDAGQSKMAAPHAQAGFDFQPSQSQHRQSQHDQGFAPRSRMTPRQATQLVPSLNFSGFVTGQPNQLAHGAARAVAESITPTFNPLFLYGGVGIGKTHLLHAIGHEVSLRFPERRILYVAAASFIDDFITAIRNKDTSARAQVRDRYRGVDLLLIDDVQFLQGRKATQEEFFHTFNALHQAGKQIVLTSDRFPSELDAFQDRLRSRFAWGLVAEIAAPDRDMRVSILMQKATARRINLPLDVIHYIADHLRNNVRELEGALNKLVLHAKISQRPLDISLTREVLGPVIELPSQRLTIDAIQRATVKHFSLRLTDLKGSKRHKAVVVPRMIAMALARKHTEASYPEIGRVFGGRDHSTVINACKRVKWMMASEPHVQTDVQAIEELLGR